MTWAGDQALTPSLEAIVKDLDPLAADFDTLGGNGRTALASLVAADTTSLDKSIRAGQVLVQKIGERDGGPAQSDRGAAGTWARRRGADQW